MQSRTEEILQAMINGTDYSQLAPPQSRIEVLLFQILGKIIDGDLGGLQIHVCTQDEYDGMTRVPTVSEPDDMTLYLVPSASSSSNNLFVEWIYAENSWEMVGSANINIPVTDVQVNGTTIVNNGVANVPYAGQNVAGVVVIAPNSTGGLNVNSNNGRISTFAAVLTELKAGTDFFKPIVPGHQHESAFYGLAKAAGADMASSSNSVGTYTDAAKAAIQSMIGVGITDEVVSGTTPTITGVSNHRYHCGEVASINFTPSGAGICDVVFTSGTTPAVLTIPNTVKLPEWFDSTSLEPSTIYEISVADGVYGVVTTWQA